MTVTLLPNEPLYLGGSLSSDVPDIFPVAIDGRPYVIEIPPYRRRIVDPLRVPTDQSSEPGEQSFSTQGLWRRSQSDFSLGAGQRLFDDTDSSRRRFYVSKGVNPWTRYELSLLPDTSRWYVSNNTNHDLVVVAGTHLYLLEGTNVSYSTNGTSFTQQALGGTGNSITTDGANIFVAVAGTNVKKGAAGGALVSFGAETDVDVIGFANGRLLVGKDNVLSELDAVGAATALKTLSFSSYTWRGITGSPVAVYAWASTSDRSDVYSIRVIETTGALGPPIYAMSLPYGETLNDMLFYGGLMILATSRGIRLAAINSDASLSFGPVIEIPNVLGLDPLGEFVWFTWTNYDATSTGLGRLDLAHLTAELVPAYASDLMATTQGTIRATARFLGLRHFTVASDGVYKETSNKVVSGTLSSGEIRYGNLERKIVSSVDVRHDPLPTGSSVTISVIDEDSIETAVGVSSDASSLGPASPFNVVGADGEEVELKLTLARATDATTGPELKRWTLRSQIAPTVTEEIELHLILKETVQTDNGQNVDYDPYVEFRYLVDLVSSKRTVAYQEGNNSYTVYVAGVELRPEQWGSLEFFEGLLVVRLVTVSPTG